MWLCHEIQCWVLPWKRSGIGHVLVEETCQILFCRDVTGAWNRSYWQNVHCQSCKYILILNGLILWNYIWNIVYLVVMVQYIGCNNDPMSYKWIISDITVFHTVWTSVVNMYYCYMTVFTTSKSTRYEYSLLVAQLWNVFGNSVSIITVQFIDCCWSEYNDLMTGKVHLNELHYLCSIHFINGHNMN